MVIATPVRLISALPVVLPTQVHAASVVASTEPSNISLDTNTPLAVVITEAPKPNFDTEVLQPLQAKQAQAATEAAQKAAKVAASKIKKLVITGDDAFAKVRACEAGSDYTRNSGNGYFGAYQYNLGTWNNYGGYARPDLAPAEVQDAKAHIDVAARGWSPWPACARAAGLL